MWNSTLAPGTKPVYQSADKKWVQSTCLEFTWQCSQVLWLQAGPTISSELHNKTIAGFSVTGWKWNTCKCPDVKYTSGSVSWTVCASGHLFLVRFVGSTRPEFIFMQRIPTRAHITLQSHRLWDIQSWDLWWSWNNHWGQEASLSFSDLFTRGQEDAEHCWWMGRLQGSILPPQPCSAECTGWAIACIYQVLEQLVSLNWKEQLFTCCLSRNESPL